MGDGVDRHGNGISVDWGAMRRLTEREALHSVQVTLTKDQWFALSRILVAGVVEESDKRFVDGINRALRCAEPAT